MKIGIEAQRIFRSGKHGMEIVAMELIRQLQRLDTVNEYVLFARDGEDRGCITENDNFRTKILGALSYADWEQVSLPVALKKIKPDIIHCTANTAPLYCPAPLLLTLHDIIFLEKTDLNGSLYQNAGNIYRKWIVPAVVKKARLIITVSEFEKQVIVDRLRLDPEKVRVIYNGVGERFHPSYATEDIERFREANRLPKDFILFLGNTAPKKNAATMIRAYVEYCDKNNTAIPLVITDYDKAPVEKALSRHNRSSLINQIIFPGYVPAEKMPLLYNCAALFVYPSLRESFGMPILEAMACGIPVVASNTSAMPEIAGDAAMQVNPESFQDIANAMATMLSDKALLDQYVQKGKERAQRFNWKNAALALKDVYTTIIASP